ncbi:COQ7 protein [Dentipellis sp. KUC8613]|nr:COQ7 protein [Dentipellis sp. KUC8613]
MLRFPIHIHNRPVFTARRFVTTHVRPQPSAKYLDVSSVDQYPVFATPQSLPASQRHVLDAVLRVDQAGEVAANYIYRGQFAVFGSDKQLGPLIQDMWEQEKKHITVMNKLQLQHHVRPTILWDVAKVAGFGLGVVTGLMGKEAAMACTEAVETVIGEHYDDQLAEMRGFEDHPSIELLKDVICEFRDDELEHLDIAVENNSQRAPAHALLSSVIGIGCKAAISVCKRV